MAIVNVPSSVAINPLEGEGDILDHDENNIEEDLRGGLIDKDGKSPSSSPGDDKRQCHRSHHDSKLTCDLVIFEQDSAGSRRRGRSLEVAGKLSSELAGFAQAVCVANKQLLSKDRRRTKSPENKAPQRTGQFHSRSKSPGKYCGTVRRNGSEENVKDFVVSKSGRVAPSRSDENLNTIKNLQRGNHNRRTRSRSNDLSLQPDNCPKPKQPSRQTKESNSTIRNRHDGLQSDHTPDNGKIRSRIMGAVHAENAPHSRHRRSSTKSRTRGHSLEMAVPPIQVKKTPLQQSRQGSTQDSNIDDINCNVNDDLESSIEEIDWDFDADSEFFDIINQEKKFPQNTPRTVRSVDLTSPPADSSSSRSKGEKRPPKRSHSIEGSLSFVKSSYPGSKKEDDVRDAPRRSLSSEELGIRSSRERRPSFQAPRLMPVPASSIIQTQKRIVPKKSTSKEDLGRTPDVTARSFLSSHAPRCASNQELKRTAVSRQSTGVHTLSNEDILSLAKQASVATKQRHLFPNLDEDFSTTLSAKKSSPSNGSGGGSSQNATWSNQLQVPDESKRVIKSRNV